MKSALNAKFLLLAIAAALTTLHLTLVWKSRHYSLLEPTFLCWASAWFLIWRKQNEFKLEGGIFANIIGIVCIAWVLLRSASVDGYDSFLRFSPIISGLGLAFLVSRLSQFKKHWRELLILGFLSIPTTSILAAIDLSPLTAEFSGSLLWYLGYPVSQDGVKLILPTGTVEVYTGCSGIHLIWQLLSLTFLFVLLFPLRWIQNLLLPIAAILIGFIVNSIRVALMAVLYAQQNREAFDYWHLGNGSLIFSMVAVCLFGGLCYFLLEQAEADDPADDPAEHGETKV